MDYTKKLLEVRDLHKAYSKEGVPTKALNGITFDVLSGEYLGIMGASGSGKTTLLNCIATVIKPTSGQILLSGANISAFDGAKLAEYRGNRIGYLFQDFALLDNLTGRENILLPLSIHNIDSSIAEKHLNDIAGFLGITDVMLLIIACALLALQFLTQMQSTKSRYLTLSILGARREQIKRSIYKQVLWYFLLPLMLACISGTVGLYAMQQHLYSDSTRIGQSYPLLIIMAFTVVLIMAIYGVAVARTATREIGKINYKPNS